MNHNVRDNISDKIIQVQVFYQAIRICNKYISNHAVRDSISDKIIQIRMSQLFHLLGSEWFYRINCTFQYDWVRIHYVSVLFGKTWNPDFQIWILQQSSLSQF